jgi:DNA-binding transcriptional regulator PaaX
MSNMTKRQDFSKKIIKILSEKKAISIPEIMEKFTPENGSTYAITRSIKGLEESGLIEHIPSGQNFYARLTKDGKRKATSIKLEAEDSLISTIWDGYWRIILLDLPESRKNERESLRYLLKKAGFICLKNSAWISPYPFEHMFTNIKKDLNLTTEMIIIVTNTVDEATEKAFLNLL